MQIITVQCVVCGETFETPAHDNEHGLWICPRCAEKIKGDVRATIDHTLAPHLASLPQGEESMYIAYYATERLLQSRTKDVFISAQDIHRKLTESMPDDKSKTLPWMIKMECFRMGIGCILSTIGDLRVVWTSIWSDINGRERPLYLRGPMFLYGGPVYDDSVSSSIPVGWRLFHSDATIALRQKSMCCLASKTQDGA